MFAGNYRKLITQDRPELVEKLTERELDVFICLATGDSFEHVSRKCGLTTEFLEKTVQKIAALLLAGT